MKIIKATKEHIDIILPMFEAYRQFYKQSPNDKKARKFITERLLKKDSIIFIYLDNVEKAVGFTQLYPSFSSVTMQRVYVLNDLFVIPESRSNGVGAALLNYAKGFAIKNNCKGLTLETAIDNPAQKLYERLGWEKDLNVFHYTWKTNN